MVDFSRWWPLPHDAVLAEVLEEYAAPGRGYHNLEHLREVLERVDELVAADGSVGDLDLVRLAAFFHDVVYRTEPGAELTNEEASAQWALRLLEGRLPADDARRVADLVRATYDHRVLGGDRAAALLLDADLAILAACPGRYERYLAGVRREYAWVPDVDFRAGRAEILRGLTERTHLFHTAHGRAQWEAAARANIAAELRVTPT